jgi:uncharacterized GH25 family protein
MGNTILRYSLAIAASLSLAAIAAGHVFWVQPMFFSPKVGDIVKINLRVGDTFPGERTPRNDEKIETFIVVGPRGQEPALGRDADTTAAIYRPKEPGTYVIAYRSKPSSVSLPADKFEAYLKEKGLEKIIGKRAESGQSERPGSEIYSRSAKAFLRCGDASTPDAAKKDLSFRVEIIPDADPAALRAGESFGLVVKSEGKPLENALIEARTPDHTTIKLTARTDSAGHASFTLPHAGMWIIDTVDMLPAALDSGADWESIWASLAFEVRAGEPAKAVAEAPLVEKK